jgi:2-methylisocitrate lyase-like PEP mutase family enzyme
MAKNMKAVRAHFSELHDEFLVIPNAWSVGEIGILEKLGFKAIATTSVGLATSLGRSDLSLSRDETLANILPLAAGTDLPIKADYEAGFADEAEAVAGNVAIAAEAGISGLSIEDRKGDILYDLALAVERIKASRAAVDMVDPNIVLVGRTKGTGNNGDIIQALRLGAANSLHQAGQQSQYPANTDGQARISGKRNGQPRFLAEVLQ